MALKDWKKSGETLWFNKKNNESVQIIKYVAIHYDHKPDIMKYVVYAGKGKEKRFTTKTKAMKYAMAYMRKH